MRLFCCCSAAAVLCGIAAGQPAEKPRFLISDVHSSPRTTQPVVRGPFYLAGRYELRFATMLDLIRMAYAVDSERVSGGPDWLELDRFDVFAKAPEASSAEARKLMLQLTAGPCQHMALRRKTRT